MLTGFAFFIFNWFPKISVNICRAYKLIFKVYNRQVSSWQSHNFTYDGMCNGIFRHACGFSTAQKRRLCVLTASSNRMSDSFIHEMFHGHYFWSSYSARNSTQRFVGQKQQVVKASAQTTVYTNRSVTPFEESCAQWHDLGYQFLQFAEHQCCP